MAAVVRIGWTEVPTAPATLARRRLATIKARLVKTIDVPLQRA